MTTPQILVYCGTRCSGSFLNICGKIMYRNVLLTDKEIALLRSIISMTLSEKVSIDRNNLTIIHNRLREIRPLNNFNQTVNSGKWA